MESKVPTSDTLDKSIVFNAKPLQFLVPVFPSSLNVSPSPHIDVTSASAPFFPFLSPKEPLQTPINTSNHRGPHSHTILSPVPLNTYRPPTPRTPNVDGSSAGPSRRKAKFKSAVGDEDGYSDMHAAADEGMQKSNKKTVSNRKTRKNSNGDATEGDIKKVCNDFLASVDLAKFEALRRAESNTESVRYVLMMYDLLKRKLNQHEELTRGESGLVRPDLKAGSFLLYKGIRMNSTKNIGVVSGIDVGDIFFFRMELCVVGMHSPSMSGIDYMTIKSTPNEEPIAVSIVDSGGYGDSVDDGQYLIYSGQGGNANKKKDKITTDQKLERGNLALEKSLHKGNDVRVIRGVRDNASSSGKVYLYDGIYRTQESWIEKGKEGFTVFKYKLCRVPGQPQAFTLWKSIQQWRVNLSSRPNVILPDLTSGAESLPVCLVNEVDNDKGPSYFTYFPSLKYDKPINSQQSTQSCSCRSGCQSGNASCPCTKKNGGSLPYTTNGILLCCNSLIYECGPSCTSPPNSRNRISQAGLKVRLEVFKTKDRGWGLRSWDPIRAGAFICEYAGEVIDKSAIGSDMDDNYLFDTTRTYEHLEVIGGNPNDSPKIPFPLVISSIDVGNVARFMNHSCDPNVYWLPVLRESYLHVAFFAIRHIPPLKELNYNYGVTQTGKADPRKKKCLCGSSRCRGYFC
ncbi:histone-lysine N-methyltransferase, H3 lysine-9 specific SUVH1-like [Impatiens glandulifera]|uniref:histone-lysine N-methyltransferase, H3 lysine-9 specific SUVH1-like n=1 Tax=Impatiens glandulifera TaxID=253017 RepID=UPI001FB181A4|nr:histone-lysine N-methyltransferase, H3 lysine-9 specific SUVH1-like [Impatiens glandulifera]